MKIFLVALIMALPIISVAQADSVHVSATRDQLYQRAQQWVSRSFVSSKAVIEVSDKDAGLIRGSGSVRLSLSLAYDVIAFKFAIAVKDGIYKYEFVDYRHSGYTDGGERDAGSLEDERPDCGYGRMTKRYWGRIKTATQEQMAALILSLNKAMNERSFVE